MNRRIKNLYKYTAAAFSIVVLLLVNACDYDEIKLNQPNEEERTVGGFIGNNFDFTLLSAALEYTGLMDTLLNSQGNYTLLAPPNTAFVDIGITQPGDFYTLDKDSLREALAYHILPQRLLSEDVPFDNGIFYNTLAGEQLEASKCTYSKQYLTLSGSLVTTADQTFINGNVQVLDKVMKYYPKGSIKDWLEELPEYSIFTAGLKRFGLLDQLGDMDQYFTLFAPDNLEFEGIGITLDSIAKMDIDKFIAARLFGAYILHDIRLHISDFRYYHLLSDQIILSRRLKGDESYYQNLTGHYLGSPGLNDLGVRNLDQNTYSFNISLYPITYGSNYLGMSDADLFLGRGVTGSVNNGLFTFGNRPPRHDHITKNGIIHNIRAILVLPEEALK